MTPFDFVNAINTSKKDLIETPEDEKQYVPFVVNRSLSYFPDTILYANEMNMISHIDNKLQFHYLLNSVRPAKRFSKWAKKDDSSDLESVKQYYKMNNEKALFALTLLSREQLDKIKEKLEQGGNNEHSRRAS